MSDFKPSDFFISLLDFFSILLPGAALTYLFRGELQSLILRSPNPALGEGESLALFLFSSYLLGHFIFLIGSYQDEAYDWVRTAVVANQPVKLARGEHLSAPLAMWLAKHIFFTKETDRAVQLAARIKARYLDPLEGSKAVNTFQWGKARLVLDSANAMETVQRYEADSKFFRSFSVVLILLGLYAGFNHWPLLSILIIAVLWLLSLVRYADQRLKATNQVYWYIITAESKLENGFRPPADAPNGFTHAGGVVVRRSKIGRVALLEYLLVQASGDPEQWVLAKGHIKPGEWMTETAVREVREETGVWARVLDVLGEYTYSAKGTEAKVQIYLMEQEGTDQPVYESRKHTWLPLDQAIQAVSFAESQALLRNASLKIYEADARLAQRKTGFERLKQMLRLQPQ